MRALLLATLLAAPAMAQETLGTDQGNTDQPLMPGAEVSPDPVPGENPLFQPDPDTLEPGVSDTNLTAQVGRGGLGQEVEAAFLGTDGQQIGTARLIGTPHGLLISVEVSGLPPSSWVAFHMHENGTCDPGSDFESAGGHYSISDTDHGLLVPTGPHSGDMPNQWVGPDGVMKAEVFNTFVQLVPGAASAYGRALVIHDGRDDYQSQPSGDAGNRIACAEIPAE